MAEKSPLEKPLDDAIAELSARTEQARKAVPMTPHGAGKYEQMQTRRAEFDAAIVVVKEVVSRVLRDASGRLKTAGYTMDFEPALQNRLRDDKLRAIPHFAYMALRSPGIAGGWLVMFGVESKDVFRDRPIYFYSGPLDVRPAGEEQPDVLVFDPRDQRVTEKWISGLVGGAISRFAQMAK